MLAKEIEEFCMQKNCEANNRSFMWNIIIWGWLDSIIRYWPFCFNKLVIVIIEQIADDCWNYSVSGKQLYFLDSFVHSLFRLCSSDEKPTLNFQTAIKTRTYRICNIGTCILCSKFHLLSSDLYLVCIRLSA